MGSLTIVGDNASILERLHDQLEDSNEVCDAELVVGSTIKRVHGCVVSLKSFVLFRALKEWCTKEVRKGLLVIKLAVPEHSVVSHYEQALEAIIIHCYGGNVEVPELLIKPLLNLALSLEITDLIDACKGYLSVEIPRELAPTSDNGNSEIRSEDSDSDFQGDNHSSDNASNSSRGTSGVSGARSSMHMVTKSMKRRKQEVLKFLKRRACENRDSEEDKRTFVTAMMEKVQMSKKNERYTTYGPTPYRYEGQKKVYFCPSCDKTASFDMSIRHHYLAQHTDFSVSCDQCDKKFGNYNYLSSHKYQCHPREGFIPRFLCDLCGFKTTMKFTFNEHKRVHTGDLVKCQFEGCNFKSSRSFAVKKHYIKKHTNDARFLCVTCGKKFFFSSDLNKHSEIHVKSCHCQYCDFRSAHNWELVNHTKKHHPEHFSMVVESAAAVESAAEQC